MEVVHKKSFSVVGFKIETNWTELVEALPRAWDKIFKRASEIKYKIDNQFLSISLKKDGDIYTELICVEVSEIASIPEGMVGLTIPEHTYAYCPHHGSIKNINDTFRELYRWTNQNGYITDYIKIDYGYKQKDKDPVDHSLFVKLDI